jgi:hypothetical protein
MNSIIVTAWNNGAHNKSGAGYGVKLEVRDRDRFFRREWKTIILELEGFPDEIEVNIVKPSFWETTCRELINIEIGRWLIHNGLAPWPKGHPPKLSLECLEKNCFLLRKSTGI